MTGLWPYSNGAVQIRLWVWSSLKTPPCTRVKWVAFVLLAFFPCFIVFIPSKLAIFPLNVVFRELENRIFGPKKDKWRIRGSKTPKPPEMPLNKGKHHNTTTGLATWIAPKLGQKVLWNLGKNAKRTNGTYFARPQPPPAYAWNGCHLWNWRFHLETVLISAPKSVYCRPLRTTFSMIVAQIVVFIVIAPFHRFRDKRPIWQMAPAWRVHTPPSWAFQ